MAATPIAAETYRPFLGGMRSPVVAPLTRFLIGLPLVLLTTQTATYFAWTIQPPMTAAFLGANYWSSALLAVLAARETPWARGRVSVSVALVFAPLTTIATFLHLEQFHLDTVYGWFWVAAYTIYPLQLGYFLVRQIRTPGTDPPRERPLPKWVKAILGLQAVVLIPFGLGLFLLPNRLAELWPWVLPPLSARAVSAWLLAFGVLAAHALVENDFARVRSANARVPVRGGVARRFSDDALRSRPEHAFFAFGAGNRGCVGSAFAWLEGVLLLASIAQRWRISLVPGFEPEPQMRVTIRPKHGMLLHLERRTERDVER